MLVKTFLKGTHRIMQRSNNDTIIRNLDTELHHSIEKEGNNEDEPKDSNYLISWFNSGFEISKHFNETAFSGVLQWLLLHLFLAPSGVSLSLTVW